MRLREAVTTHQNASLTAAQRRRGAPRNAYERKVLRRLFLWHVTLLSLLYLTPMDRIVWLITDVSATVVVVTAYLIWYRRRTPETGANSIDGCFG